MLAGFVCKSSAVAGRQRECVSQLVYMYDVVESRGRKGSACCQKFPVGRGNIPPLSRHPRSGVPCYCLGLLLRRIYYPGAVHGTAAIAGMYVCATALLLARM